MVLESREKGGRAEADVGFDERGGEFGGAGVGVDGLLAALEGEEGVAEVVPSLGDVGAEGDRLAESVDRVGVVADQGEGVAETVMGFGEVGAEFDGAWVEIDGGCGIFE